MRIFEKTYWQLMDAMPVVPPEIGGILGGSPSVICEYKIDTGTGKGCGCSYAPVSYTHLTLPTNREV